ncbi:MAG: 4-hydroxybenzoate octaprenyltransferase [Pseudomonadota bacterium]
MTGTGHNSAPPADGRVHDATERNWVDAYCPSWSRPWLRLSRADRPAGTWLLLIPCWWAIGLAIVHQGWAWSDLWLFAGSAIGAFLMRGAGCTWNDHTDRHIDGEVARTRSRPLPSGQVTPLGALIWMCLQALLAFLILLTFNMTAILLGIASLALVAVYPFAKRFTWWPQVFLGLAFNWGALLLWTAKTGEVNFPSLCLYLSGIAWTLHYDTIYDHQDREDDALIGVRSTARLFGENTKQMLWIFSGLVLIFAALAVITAGGGWIGVLGAIGLFVHLAWQTSALDIDDPAQCLALFRSNRSAGLVLLAGIMCDTVM